MTAKDFIKPFVITNRLMSKNIAKTQIDHVTKRRK